MEPARRALAPTALTVAALALVAGCSTTNPYTTTEGYVPGDGMDVILGPVHVASLMVVTDAEGEPGSLVVRLVNTGTEDASVSMTATGNSALDETFTVPARTTLAVGPEAETSVVIPAVNEAPGKLIPITVSVAGGESAEVPTPVLTDNFDIYATLVPTPSPTATAPSQAGPSPSSAAGVEPTGEGPQATDEVEESPAATSTPRTLSPSGTPTG